MPEICRVLSDKEKELVHTYLEIPPTTLTGKVNLLRFLSRVKDLSKEICP
jgi:hypothetical protein